VQINETDSTGEGEGGLGVSSASWVNNKTWQKKREKWKECKARKTLLVIVV